MFTSQEKRNHESTRIHTNKSLMYVEPDTNACSMFKG
jgi:hypothetical protein